MYYKNAVELYFENVRDKWLFIPRLSYKDEVSFNTLNEKLNHLSAVLNTYPSWRQFLMFGIRNDYNRLSSELLEFFEFWTFDVEQYGKIKICKETSVDQ